MTQAGTTSTATYTLIAVIFIWLVARAFKQEAPKAEGSNMSRVTGSKSKDGAIIAEIREITGATLADAQKLVKKHKTVEGAIDAFFNDSSMQRHAMGNKDEKNKEKKLGDIWERFKDPSDPKLIKIDGTMQLCEELGIDPESDPVLFCLAADLGSKATGEWEKGPWVTGWAAMPGNIDSVDGMKARLPALRERLNAEPAYFKKVYLHTFDLVKAPGARTLALDTALDMWNLFIPPALRASPSALSRICPGSPPSSSSSDPPQFSKTDFDAWIEFQRQKGKAVSKDTWTLFIDFVRSIDKDFKEYDEEAAWPSTIDDFVEHVRTSRKAN